MYDSDVTQGVADLCTRFQRFVVVGVVVVVNTYHRVIPRAKSFTFWAKTISDQMISLGDTQPVGQDILLFQYVIFGIKK